MPERQEGEKGTEGGLTELSGVPEPLLPSWRAREGPACWRALFVYHCSHVFVCGVKQVHNRGGENKTGWCARVMNPTVILRMHLFYAQSKNLATHILVNEAQCEHLCIPAYRMQDFASGPFQ